MRTGTCGSSRDSGLTGWRPAGLAVVRGAVRTEGGACSYRTLEPEIMATSHRLDSSPSPDFRKEWLRRYKIG